MAALAVTAIVAKPIIDALATSPIAEFPLVPLGGSLDGYTFKYFVYEWNSETEGFICKPIVDEIDITVPEPKWMKK